jgi:hypothetical protein
VESDIDLYSIPDNALISVALAAIAAWAVVTEWRARATGL